MMNKTRTMLILVIFIKPMKISKRDRVILAVIVFIIQAVIMQLFGTYIW